MTELYGSNGVVIFKDLPGFSTHDEKFQEVFLNFLEDTIKEHLNDTITIIVGRDKLELMNAFSKKSIMLDKFFEFKIEEVKPDEHHRIISSLRRPVPQPLQARDFFFQAI